MLVGLDQGMDEIQRNADVLVACIREAMRRTDAPLVVGGLSMGGLISRYALAAMEARGEDHHTAVFVTLDTPHGGTYTSLAAQWFVQTFRPYLPALAGYAEQLDSPANQQFDLWWLHDGVAAHEPAARGVDARSGGGRQLPAAAAPVGHVLRARRRRARGAHRQLRLLRWAGEPWVSAQTLDAHRRRRNRRIGGTGSWPRPPELRPLRLDAGIAWDGAPGGQEPYNGQVAAHRRRASVADRSTHAYDAVVHGADGQRAGSRPGPVCARASRRGQARGPFRRLRVLRDQPTASDDHA